MTDFEEIPEFSKDLRKLYKKFRSIYDDLEAFEKALASEFPNQALSNFSVKLLYL